MVHRGFRKGVSSCFNKVKTRTRDACNGVAWYNSDLSTGPRSMKDFFLQRSGGCPCDLFRRDTDNSEEYNIHVKGTINPKEMCTISRSRFTGVVVARCTV